MPSRLTISALGASVIFTGLFAGVNLQKSLVEIPALRQLPLPEWASYVRRADLGNGLILYPTSAVLIALLVIGTLLAARREGLMQGKAAAALYAAAALALGGLLTTIKAAPNLLGLRHADLSEADLRARFDGFAFWHDNRCLLLTLAFLALVWAFSLILSCRPRALR